MGLTKEDDWLVKVLEFDPAHFQAGASGQQASGQQAPGDDAPEATPGGFIDFVKRLLGVGKESKPAAGAPKHPILGTTQLARAAKLLEKMSKEDAAEYGNILKGAAGKEEKEYLTKSLAAGHSIAEIKGFAAKIKGKDAQWMQDNLSLTGSSTGSGVQQQFSHSCNATTVEAVKGELDPIYALKMHEDNPNMGKVDGADPNKENPNLAADQKAMLESTYHGAAAGDHAGVAVGRDNVGKAGRGRWANDLLDQMKDVTGLTYDTKKVGKDVTTDEAIAGVTEAVSKGEPVPIVIGNKQAAYTHYVLVTASEPGPPRMFSIHDPWSGKTVIRSEKQMKDGTLDIAGSNQITAFEKPTQVAVN